MFEDRGEPSQGIKEVQSTIALFDMHNVQTKIMVSGFRDIRKILEFPGASGFSISKEQIVFARLPTARSCCIPPQSASSLPENAVMDANEVNWPPKFFDGVETGGSGGSFVRCFSLRQQTLILTIHRDVFYHTGLALQDLMAFVRDNVVNYKILMLRLTDPRTGMQTLAREGAEALMRTVNSKKDLRSAEKEWKNTMTGRCLPEVEWITARVDKCEAWFTSDGRIKAVIPDRWDRRKAAARGTCAEGY